MIIRLDKQALLEHQNNKDSAIGVEGDAAAVSGKVSETEKIVGATIAKIVESGTPAVGISASNSGRGHDLASQEDGDTGFTPTLIEGVVEEEPSSIDDSPEVSLDESEGLPNDSGKDSPQQSS